MSQEILKLTLYRKYFDEILSGTKTIEYRENKDYWTKRLFSKKYDCIHFKNGYNSNSPEFFIELKMIILKNNIYELHLGKIIQ